MINGRGDAYCGMLNCSYNLGMRHLKGYIPEYPIGTADEIADKMIEFVPIARTLLRARVGDVLQLPTPAGVKEIEVLAVAYPAPAGPA